MRKSTFYTVIFWVLSVIIAYTIGWTNGLRGAARVATGVTQGAFDIVWISLIVVALLAGVAAFRARGYIGRKTSPPQPL